jgi:hypothetical protein
MKIINNFKTFLIETQALPDWKSQLPLQYIADHAKPCKTFSVGSQEIKKGNGFDNELADNSEFYLNIFKNKLISLIKYYSNFSAPAPYGFAFEESDFYGSTRNGVKVPGILKVLWHQDYPADILLQFAKNYTQLVVKFLPKLINISSNNVSSEDWYYTYVHTHQGKNIDSVMILLYKHNPYE